MVDSARCLALHHHHHQPTSSNDTSRNDGDMGAVMVYMCMGECDLESPADMLQELSVVHPNPSRLFLR